MASHVTPDTRCVARPTPPSIVAMTDQPALPPVYWTENKQDGDFDEVDHADVAPDFAEFRGMLEEYARHNGHADFLRERIDGVTG